MQNIKPISLLVLLGFIWGSGYSIARFAMTHGVPPLGYAFWQSVGPVVFLFIFQSIKKVRLPFSREHVIYYFFTGLLGIVIPNTTIYFAAAHLPAGILAVVVNTVPILAYPMALAIHEEDFYWLRIIGLAIAIAGLLCLLLPKTSLPSPNMIPWALLALIAPFCFASCAIISSRYRPKHTDSASLSTGMLLFSSLILAPIVFGLHQFYSFAPPYHLAHGAVILEIILSSIGYILFFELLKVAGPIYYSLTGGLVGLTGLFWGTVLFNERLTSLAVVSIFLILLGIFLVTLKFQAYARLASSDLMSSKK